MRKPSIKTLSRLICLDKRVTAKELRRVMHMSNAELIEYFGAIDSYALSRLRSWPMSRLRMWAMSKATNAHGVEYMIRTNSREDAAFLNMGDPYSDTLIFWRGVYRVQSVGDFIEVMERQGIKFK